MKTKQDEMKEIIALAVKRMNPTKQDDYYNVLSFVADSLAIQFGMNLLNANREFCIKVLKETFDNTLNEVSHV